MTQWYYNDPARGQVGPLDGERLREAWQQRELAADTLVWREGMDQWRPLSQLAGELGLDPAGGAALPPPLPGVAPAPRKGLSGGAIAAIVAGACLFLLIPVLGIVAAIAIPAYQDYTIRARVSQALIAAGPLKAQVADFASAEGRCPVNGEGGLGAPEDHAGDGLAAIHVGPLDNGHCALELEFGGTGSPLDGNTLLLEAQSGADGDSGWDWDWRCSSDSIRPNALPRHCRDGNLEAGAL